MNTNSLFNGQRSAKRIALYPELEKVYEKENDQGRKHPGATIGSVKFHTIVERIRKLVEAHMDDEHYCIDRLCRDAGISRSNLHKKLKAATGLSTTMFIRVIKLKQAKLLLTHTDLNITQVAYETGFKDPTYFSRVFSDSFHISPKDFRKRATL
jgi:AraC-like DNA-binding protein